MILSYSVEQTKQCAADFAKTLQGGEVIGLEGDLGSGKTTFVQGLAQTLEVTTAVRSPTFTLMNIHAVHSKWNSFIKYLIHVDAYRLPEQTEIYHIGLDEWLGRKDTVIFIEWPHLFKKEAIPFSHYIMFTYQDEEIRKIEGLFSSGGS